ncbi:hypothetical protein GCM10027578_21820 [Spirosoma luteolum]
MNKVKTLYNELSELQKSRVRLAWCAKFKLTERQFTNRLNNPEAVDYAFWSIVFKRPTDELMDHLFDHSIRKTLTDADTTPFAVTLGLTRA